MQHMDLVAMAMPNIGTWGSMDLLVVFVMWAVMMVAMMVPSATPMLLTFATVARSRRAQGRAFVPVWVFLGGYLVLWMAFSLASTLAHWGLHSLALISPMTVGTSPVLGSVLLVAGRDLSVDALQTGLFEALPDAVTIPADLLARRHCGRFPHGRASRSLLPRLLLALDGDSVRSRRDEPRVDCHAQRVRAIREDHSQRVVGGQGCRTCADRLRWLDSSFGWILVFVPALYENNIITLQRRHPLPEPVILVGKRSMDVTQKIWRLQPRWFSLEFTIREFQYVLTWLCRDFVPDR
jgi:hypothetical protein